MKEYDVVIIGAGPAGITAAIYALRSGLKTLLIENKMVGGQATLTFDIKNYPGFENINGMDLVMQMHAQAENLGAEMEYADVTGIDLKNKIVSTDSGKFSAKAIVLAMGASARRLGVENEDRLIGSGVAYCAVCDGAFFKNVNIVLVGGGNSAVEDAIYLSNIASNITIVNNMPAFNAQKILQDELRSVISKNNNITVFHNHVVSGIVGEKRLQGVTISHVDSGEEKHIECQGMFVAIGRKPDTELVKGQIEIDNMGYIKANENMHTSMEGVFVAGDIRVKSLRQIVTACADGAIAATEANYYISRLG